MQENIRHQTMYQGIVCLRRIISEHEDGNLSIGKMAPILIKATKLFPIYKNIPNHLWNIMNLTNQLLRVISAEQAMEHGMSFLEAIREIIGYNFKEALAICAISDYLQNLLEAVASDENSPNIYSIVG